MKKESTSTIPSELEFDVTDLPITLYLNQRLAFDLLAILEGGFSSFSTVQSSSSTERISSVDGKAQLGISNMFAFLGVRLNAQGSRQLGNANNEKITEEIVHTPTSLFARLRKDLQDRSLVCNLASSDSISDISPGKFVEFKATLRKSPLIDIVDSFSQLIPLISLANNDFKQQSNPANKKNRSQNRSRHGGSDETSIMKNQIDSIASALNSDNSQDLIAEFGKRRIVLTTEQDFFIDPSMNNIIDGTFRIFGKVTRVIVDEKNSISLLRKTALGKFGTIVEELASAMENMQEIGFSESIETKIFGPTMQVIPIAIFS